jgi:type II secretory pathway pseudopilin PulG
MKKSFQLSFQAFSLVEVVLALGIVSFAVLTILGLLPVGIKLAHNSLQETGAQNVVSQIVADRLASPYVNASLIYGLPSLASGTDATGATSVITSTFGVTENFQPTDLTSGSAYYRIDSVITPPPESGGFNPYIGYLKVSWPANAATNNAQSIEVVVSYPQH